MAKGPVEKLSTAMATYVPTAETWTITLPRLLRSPNATLWRHWRIKHREAKVWRALLLQALLTERIVGAAIVRTVLAGHRAPAAGPRRVRIERWCARRQQFIRDRDNLAFCGKHLVDALVGIGLLVDDDPAWAERPIPTQHVSADGRAYTVVVVEPIHPLVPDGTGL
jgi:hypothetical protein